MSQKDLAVLKELTLLYVEDDETIAQMMIRAMERLFGKVIHAPDGLKGLNFFESENPDMVITDIRMPEMDGIQMSAKIREKSDSIPIIISTAHNETEFLHQAIQVGVSEYIVKPFEVEVLIEKLARLAKGIRDRKDAETYHREKKAEEINQTEKVMIRDIGNALPVPFVIMDGESVVHLNFAFLGMLLPDQIDEINDSKNLSCFESTFQNRKGYAASLSEIDEVPKKVMVNKDGKPGFYEVACQSISLRGQDRQVKLFYFHDITDIEKQRLMIQYQKNKLENLNELLSGYYFHQLTENRKAKEQGTSTPVAEEVPLKVKDETPLIDSTHHADATLDDKQRDILRRSHTHKTTAEEYVAEIGSELVDEIVELQDTENDIRTVLDRFVAFKDSADLVTVGRHLKQYSNVIYSLIEFADLATALQVLGDFLFSLDGEMVEKNEKKILLYMHNIMDDLAQWRLNIFESPAALDIHYLDSSLFSSCLQFQLELQPKEESEEEEDDLGLELF